MKTFLLKLKPEGKHIVIRLIISSLFCQISIYWRKKSICLPNYESSVIQSMTFDISTPYYSVEFQVMKLMKAYF